MKKRRSYVKPKQDHDLPLHFYNYELAKEVGVNPAILVNHLQYWITKNKKSGDPKTNIEGKTWTFNSCEKMRRYLPEFSRQQIRTALDKLVKAGIVVKDRRNDREGDTTTWYRFVDERLFLGDLNAYE